MEFGLGGANRGGSHPWLGGVSSWALVKGIRRSRTGRGLGKESGGGLSTWDDVGIGEGAPRVPLEGRKAMEISPQTFSGPAWCGCWQVMQEAEGEGIWMSVRRWRSTGVPGQSKGLESEREIGTNYPWTE